MNGTRLTTGLVALGLGLGLLASPPAAQAATAQLDVCNSVSSAEAIRGYLDGRYGPWIDPGQCQSWTDSGGRLRVEIINRGYRYGLPGKGFGYCRVGPAHSNPPEAANGRKVTYRVYANENCTN